MARSEFIVEFNPKRAIVNGLFLYDNEELDYFVVPLYIKFITIYKFLCNFQPKNTYISCRFW